MSFTREIYALPVDAVSRVWRMARVFRRSPSIPSVTGCAPPSTRRAMGSISSSVPTASRRNETLISTVSRRRRFSFRQRIHFCEPSNGYIFRRAGRSCLISASKIASNVQRVVAARKPVRRVPRLRAPLQAPIESKDGKNGTPHRRVPPRASFHYQLAYDVKLHRPVRGHPGELSGRLEPGESAGTRPARMHS